MPDTSTKPGFYNVIRWPDANGKWWLVAESDNGYIPLLELHPHWNKKRELEPTFDNQLWTAAELLVNQGMNALENPHAATGRMCKCGSCFCCAALDVLNRAREVQP